MNPLISLVIPVYNVEKYLPRCMETVFAQTYDNFEIILVDDGSTDSSGKMCDEYAAKDDRVRVFHKENGGLSDARNFGVQKAGGDLVSFIDSDDCVTEDYLQYLYDLKEKYGADMACAGKLDVKGEQIKDRGIKEPAEVVLNAEESLKRICYTTVAAYSRIYQKEMLLENPYPKGRLYEDLAVTCKIIGSCNNIAFSDKNIYYYFLRKGGISHKEINEKQYDLFLSANEQLDYISRKYPNAKSAAEYRCALATVTFLNNLFYYSHKDKKNHFCRAKEFVKPFLYSTIRNRAALGHIRIACIAIRMGYLPSRILWKSKKFVKKILGWE